MSTTMTRDGGLGPFRERTSTTLPHTACDAAIDAPPFKVCPAGRLVREVEVRGPDEHDITTHFCDVWHVDRDGNRSHLFYQIIDVLPDGIVLDENGERVVSVETAVDESIRDVLAHLAPSLP